MGDDRRDRLYERADAILDGRAHGFGMPILWHLALRRHPDAMLALASRIEPGLPAHSFSGAGLERRAFRLGSEVAGQHLAMSCFNRNDLVGYRLWLRRAERAGDPEAGIERRRFETRLPHADAALVGRRRPWRKADGYWQGNRRASRPTKWYPPDRDVSVHGRQGADT